MVTISLFKRYFPAIDDQVFTSKFVQIHYGFSDEKYALMIVNEQLCCPNTMHIVSDPIQLAGQFYCTFNTIASTNETHRFISGILGNASVEVVMGLLGLLSYRFLNIEACFDPPVFIDLLRHKKLEPIFHQVFDAFLSSNNFG